MKSAFFSSLYGSQALILDGATGTELNRRGVDTGLPLWSANALLNDGDTQILKQIHKDYLHAGADILTTNTFRTHRRALSRIGKGGRALELTRRAVAIAREAMAEVPSKGPRYLAGSISTLEDCYQPDLVPPDDQLQTEHAERIQHLVESGVDIILIETINTIREARVIAKLSEDTGVPVVASFVCNQDGKVLSGESLTDAADELLPLGVAALGVNCGPTSQLLMPLLELQKACGDDFPLIAYGNIGYADENTGWINTDSQDPFVYCAYATDWPVKIIGGCCGTTPEHIAALKSALRDNRPFSSE